MTAAKKKASKKAVAPTQPAGNVVPIVKVRTASSAGPTNGGYTDFLTNPQPDPSNLGHSMVMNPDLDPIKLNEVFECSAFLRPNIANYVFNITQHGYKLSPNLDVSCDDCHGLVKTSLLLKRQEDAGFDNTGSLEDTPDLNITDSQVEEVIEKIKIQQEIERLKINEWFRRCGRGIPFSKIRGDLKWDEEKYGNAFLEVVRDKRGLPARISRLDPCVTRLVVQDEEFTTVLKRSRSASLLGMDAYPEMVRFRRFVQTGAATADSPLKVNVEQLTWFKQYGDPRVLSIKSGKYYTSEEAMYSKEPKTRPATEIIHFAVPGSKGPYGVPRWIGALREILGSKEAACVNLAALENNNIPALAILVSGGSLGENGAQAVADFMKTVKGKESHNKVLVLEAEGEQHFSLPENSPRTRIEFKELRNAQQGDALFLNYDERNSDKVGSMFRLPRLFRGDIRDFNRSTAQAAMQFVESQVFAPERKMFDDILNGTILRDLGVVWHDFTSKGPSQGDPEQLTKMLQNVSSFMAPSILQELAKDAFSKDYSVSNQPWAKVPMPFYQQGVRADGENIEPNQGSVASSQQTSDSNNGDNNED